MSDECKYYYYDSGYSCALRREQENDSHVDSDDVKRFCWGYNYNDCPVYKKYIGSSDTGCFLTSACVEAMGLADDCYELTTLRAFRDGYLRSQPYGVSAIAEYYKIAPPLVAKIKARSDSREYFLRIYDELVAPCVKLIEQGKNEQAYKQYREYVSNINTIVD